MTVYLHKRESIFATQAVSSIELSWHENLRVDGIVPQGSVMWVNGERVDGDTKVHDGDHVTFCPMPKGPITLAKFLAYTIASFVIGAALRALLGPKIPQVKGGDEESPTYGFSGLHNARIEGLPIQVAYGRIRVPGQIIGEYIESHLSPPETDYWFMMSFGHGPIEAVGDQLLDTHPSLPLKSNDPNFPLLTGCQVEGNNLENFDGVEAHVRLGNAQQTSIPGFEITRQGNEVAFLLEQTTTGSSSNAAIVLTITTYKVPATADPIWATYGEAFDFTEDFDGVTVVVQFPQGLYTQGSNVDPSNFDLLARYIELDGAGVPIASGGPDADGYVRLFPFPRLTQAKRAPFTNEYTFWFLDPQTFQYDTLGKALNCLGSSSNYAKTTTLMTWIPSPWLPAGTFISEMTIEGWFSYEASPNVLVGWSNGTTLGTMTQGFTVGIAQQLFGAAGTAIFEVPTVTIGATGGAVQYWEHKQTPLQFPTFFTGEGNWYHVAVTFKSTGAGVGTLSVFGNGRMIFSVATAVGIKSAHASSNPFHVGFSPSHGVAAEGLADEVNWYSVALTSAEIFARYNGGIGVYQPTPPSLISDLISGYHFEDVGTCTDYSGHSHHMALQGAATSGSIDGVVFVPGPNNVRKRARYRVEVMRNNVDSIAPETIDDATWIEAIGLLDQAFSYPGIAILAAKIPASEQLNTSVPTITQEIRGRKVPVWDGSSTTFPAAPELWSSNPAWCALDLLTNTIYGLGNLYTLTDIDLIGLQALADHCDEFVDDARGLLTAPTHWTDMAFTSSVPDSFITITFTYAAYTLLRARLTTDDYLGWTGVPVIGGIDTNVGGAILGDFGALQIRSFIDFGNAITVYWDENTYGAPWTSGTSLSSHATVAGDITGREHRFELDVTYDDDAGAWDRLCEMLATCRAAPIRDGNKIRFRVSRPRDPVDIVTQTSIVEGSFEVEYGGAKDRPNAYIADFHDRFSNYERAPASLEDPSVQNSASLDTIRRESISLRGIVRRSQVMRHLAHLLNCNRLLKRRGSFGLKSDGLAYDAGDVVELGHDLASWGTGGRVLVANTDSAIKLDRDVVIGAGTYTLKIRNQFNGTYEERTVSSGAGSYAAGTAISVSSAFSWIPTKYDPFQLGTGDPMLVEIVAVSLERDLGRTVQWIEYNDEVFEDEWFDDLPGQEPDSSAAIGPKTIPGDVAGLSIEELSRETQAGTRVCDVALTWTHDPETVLYIDHSVVWWKVQDGADWREIGRVSGRVDSITLTPPTVDYGDTVLFAVQPVSTACVRRRPQNCAQVGLYPQLLPPAPEAPTNFRAEIVGDQVIYSWTAQSTDRGVTYEARRGGWILGQVIFSGVAGESFGPTHDWASGPEDAAGRTDPLIYLRAVSPSGQMSEAATVVLTPADVPSLDDESVLGGDGLLPLGNADYEIQAWEDFGGAGQWLSGGSPDATLLGGQVTDEYLEFAPGNLLMTYETAVQVSFPTGTDAIPRRCMVEAFVEGEQVYPQPASAFLLPVGHPGLARFSAEGPLYTTPDEPNNCAIVIQWQYTDTPDGSYLERRIFKPGVYRLVTAKFRVIVTRPNEDYNVRIFRFCTRIRRAMRQNDELTPVEHVLRTRALRG